MVEFHLCAICHSSGFSFFLDIIISNRNKTIERYALLDYIPLLLPLMTMSDSDIVDSSRSIHRFVRAFRHDPNSTRDQPVDLSFEVDGKPIGKGTFATVYRVTLDSNKEVVAMKEVLLDPKHKNRELEIMLELNHPNIVQLKYYFNREMFNDQGLKTDYSCLMMDLIPETVQSLIKRSHSNLTSFSRYRDQIRLYTFQMYRALAYLHQRGIAHRDVKPSNLLVDPSRELLKLCDFGSAKHLLPNDVSVSYICSRYYRAPELLLGCTSYTPSIDVWAGACVMAEFYSGVPLFKGKRGECLASMRW